MKTIVLTGGGTAGHVTPNLALLPILRKEGYTIYYIGSENGIEKELMEAENIPYYGVPTGKVRRYLSKENVKDMVKVVKGVTEARRLIRDLKPDIVFSKGGFVAVPVVLGAKANGVPVVIHESDMTPGLANKVASKTARVICTTFKETLAYLDKEKGIHTGSPLRASLFEGDKMKGLKQCNFTKDKPVLLMMGGSLGARRLNEVLRESLQELTKQFQIVHLCGRGNLAEELKEVSGYQQFEYVKEGLEDLMAMADIVVSRAGSNAICEIVALRKPNLLIPLSKSASRGDQIENAYSFAKQGFSMVLEEESLSREVFLKEILMLFEKREEFIHNMSRFDFEQGTNRVMEQIRRYS